MNQNYPRTRGKNFKNSLTLYSFLNLLPFLKSFFKMAPVIWPFILLSYASLFVFGISDNVRGPLFPEILKQFEVSDSVGSLMFALSAFSTLIASYGSRKLLRHYDRLSVLRLGALALTFSMWGMASAWSFVPFLIFSFFFGLSMGIIGLIPNILVSVGTPSIYKQRMLSGLHTMYGLASLMAPLLAAIMERLTGNWRFSFLAASVAPLMLLIYSFSKSHKNLHKKSEFSLEHHKANKKRNFKPQMFLAIMLSLAVATEIMVSSRLALFMQRQWNFSMEHSSLYVTYFFIAMMIGRFLFAVVHFKTSARRLLIYSLVVSLICMVAGLWWNPLLLSLVGFTIAPFYPLTISWISEQFPEDLDSAISYLMAVDSVMLITMHLSVGKITDLSNIHTAFHLGVVFSTISLLMVYLYPKLFKPR